MIEEYREEREVNGDGTPLDAKQRLAAALAAIATEASIPDLIDLVREPAHGETRGILLHGIKKSKSEIAVAAIEEFAKDPTLRVAIASWKKKRS